MAKKTPRQPALFNPKLVCALSLLFTPIFGAALQARNWTELGKTHEAAASRFWVRSTVWLLILFVVVQTLFRNEEIMSWFGPYFLVVLWGAWMLTSGWKQLNYVAKNVGKFYEPRPIGKAITIGVAGWLFYGLISTTIALALHLTGIEPIEAAKKDVEESPGVVIRVPKGSTEAIVEPLPPEAAQTDDAEKNTP
ncbi:hypothetical protein H6A60_09175 [Sutterella massiliensis]|uniref:Uncharacterized protein n=1 Tax=Sutterella massiliensis TaxID=1816689 RepID=A0ABS2DTK5_9BURK|nr:hypothetical protein [Sutterella massiliensis]MBM6704651.1 hypothetical protein [Sutterella massiliensis]